MLTRLFIAVSCLPLLTACSGMSLPAIEAATAVVAGGTATAIATDKVENSQMEIHGTYENGFWFDRDLFSVWVISASADQSKRVAHETATKACVLRNKMLRFVKAWGWQERALFIPIKLNRFSYEMKFRCEGTESQSFKKSTHLRSMQRR